MTDRTPPSKTDDAVHPAARPFLWLDKPRARDAVSLAIVLVAVALLVTDFFVHRHHAETAISARAGFYAIFGFISFALAVLAGWPLREILSRPADYYGESESDNG